jgi:hypothetical protein
MEKTNYYAIIPGNVRYDKNLKANCKLLYGEITALCNEKGYCWASNDYFAKLYLVTPQAISKWVKQLSDFGYISLEYVREGKEIKQRKIRLEVSTNIDRVSTNVSDGYQQKVKDNNTYINNTSIMVSSKPNKKILLSEVDINTLSEQDRIYFKIAIGFRDLFIKNKKALGVNDFKDQENATYKGYVDPIRLAFTEDKKTEEDFRKVYAFLMKDEFWMKNIMSTRTLREKMSDLLLRSSSLPKKKLKLPQGYFNMKLNNEQKKLLPGDELKRYERNMIKLEMDGGFIKQAPIEYED